MSRRIAVVGAGVTGLAAARAAAKAGADVTVLEAADEPGGSIRTVRRDGFVLELGPDALLTQKPAALDLIRELGLGDRIIGTNPEHRRSFVLSRGRLHPTPDGFYLLAPVRFGPLLATGLLSWRGKLRAGLDLVLPRGPALPDESLADFVRRRLGREVLDRLAQPLVAGIYTAEAERLSLRATFPLFPELEARHRSVILGLRARRSAARAGSAEASASGARYGVFASLEGGLGVLVDALVAALPAGAVRCGVRVASLDRTRGGWRLRLENGEALEADGVVLALPAPGAAHLLRPLARELGDEVGGIETASAVTVNLGYRREQIRHPLDGFGFVVPDVEGLPLIACTFSHVKFPGRAPAGQALLRAFLGGTRHPEHAGLPAADLAALAEREVGRVLGISGEPLFADVTRHRQAMPQYHVGHLDRVTRIRDRLRALPALALAGNYLGGPGIPDCVRSGETSARSLLDGLAASTN